MGQQKPRRISFRGREVSRAFACSNDLVGKIEHSSTVGLSCTLLACFMKVKSLRLSICLTLRISLDLGVFIDGRWQKKSLGSFFVDGVLISDLERISAD